MQKKSSIIFLSLLITFLILLFSFSKAEDFSGRSFVVDEKIISGNEECGQGFND